MKPAAAAWSLWLCAAAACIGDGAAQQARERTVFLHYLPWYTLDATADYSQARRGWCGVGSAVAAADCADASQRQYTGEGPLIGEYSQRDADVLEYHLLLASAAGVDVLLINVNPAAPLQVEVARAVFATAAALRAAHGAFGLKLAISYDNHGATTAAEVQADFAVVAELLALGGGADSFVDTTGGPMVLLWSENAAAEAYAAAKAALGSACTVVARNPRAFAESDGNFAWVLPVQGASAQQLANNWGQQYLIDFEWGMANNQGALDPAAVNTLSMGAVYPGFDDSNVPVEWNGGTPRQIARGVNNGSSTYELTWEFALDYAPQRYWGPTAVQMDWLQVSKRLLLSFRSAGSATRLPLDSLTSPLRTDHNLE